MNDFHKIFKRDRVYRRIMAVIMLLVTIYMFVNVYGLEHKLFHLDEYIERSQYLHELWDNYPEMRNPDGVCLEEIPYWFLEGMIPVTVAVAFIAQAAWLLMQETQNRMEVLRTFPVKSRNLLTCHYLSGLLTAGIPLFVQTLIIRLDILYIEKNTDFIFMNKEQLWLYILKAMIIFILHYALLIACRKVTNHVPGTVFTFIVTELAIRVSAGYCLGLYWDELADDRILSWVFWAAIAGILILVSYIADQKKDDTRNGFYAFPAAHWLVMGIVFMEVCFIFYGVYGGVPKAISYLIAIAASMLITFGVHFVTKPKMI